MDFKRVAIVGVDYITTSIALALKAQEGSSEIVGYDPEAVRVKLAKSQGAFDRVERGLGQACKNADLVIVAMPLPAIRETFAAIAPHLRPGCLVTDTARLKVPVMRWAEELLPENVAFVGGHPILSPTVAGLDSLKGVEAKADLLADALYCLTIPPRSSAATIDTFAGLVRLLGAQPFFIDATEHDGLQAGVEGLPNLLVVALLRATVDTPGWQEMRKFAGHRFAVATEGADDIYDRHAAVFLNRENVLRRLNVLLTELVYLRDLLSQDDPAPSEETFVMAAESRARWLHERGQGLWTTERGVSMEDVPTMGDRMTEMIFGGSVARKLKPRRPSTE